MPTALSVLLDQLRQRHHRPIITSNAGGRIEAKCERCNMGRGTVLADAEGEYINLSARGNGFGFDCSAEDEPEETTSALG